MTKVHGKRYAYKFDFHGLMAACQQQAQGGDPTASMISAANYKYHQHHQHHHNLSCDLSGGTAQAAPAPPPPIYTTVGPSLPLPLNPLSTSATTSSSLVAHNTSAAHAGSSILKPSPTNPTTSALLAPTYSTSYWPY